ncbi:hypothetical protein Tco_1509616 [Tanacetum coccineum]
MNCHNSVILSNTSYINWTNLHLIKRGWKIFELSSSLEHSSSLAAKKGLENLLGYHNEHNHITFDIEKSSGPLGAELGKGSKHLGLYRIRLIPFPKLWRDVHPSIMRE